MGGGAYAILCPQPPCFKQQHSSLAAVSIRLNAVESVTKVLYCKILRLTGHLGSGQFGTVHKGVWSHPKGIKEVAVKTLKEDATQTDRVKFLQEAVIMGQFRHPSVILLYGVVGRGNTVSLVAMNACRFSLNLLQLMLVIELASKGDLKQLLHSIRPEYVLLLQNLHHTLHLFTVLVSWHPATLLDNSLSIHSRLLLA